MKLIQPRPKKTASPKKGVGKKHIHCNGCKYYFITWDKNRPYGCRALNFKSKITPCLVVFQSSGIQCQVYEPKSEK